MKRKKIRIRWKNVIAFIILLITLTTLIISLIKIINWFRDSKSSKNEIKAIQDNTKIEEKKDTKETEIIQNEEIKENDPYWDYIGMNLIDVDFTELKEKNSDVVGWIKVNGTNINYPFVQTNNNDYYLHNSFEKRRNIGGWIFLDYRNNKNDLKKNTIIYGHGMLNDSMFGTLRKILKNGWFDNYENHIVRLSTEKENTLWQVFSVYKIPTTNDYIKVNFDSNESFIKFENMLLERSVFNFNTTLNENDKILTLSTCYDNDNKVVLHAKLIKIEKK